MTGGKSRFVLECPLSSAEWCQTSADNCAKGSAVYGRSIGERAVLRLHFVVLENDCDRDFALTINVRRLSHNRRALSFRRRRLAQDRFDLLLRHTFAHPIHVRLGDSLAHASLEQEHEQEYEHEDESRHHL